MNARGMKRETERRQVLIRDTHDMSAVVVKYV